jgi:uncharacterized protein
MAKRDVSDSLPDNIGMTSAAKPFFDNAGIPVKGFLHVSANTTTGTLVITHGAGGDCNTALLVALAEAFSASGMNVLRCDLPFRQMRPKGPPSPSNAKRDQEGLRRAVVLMRERFSGRVYLGGQSYGGRQASMLAAAEPELADGLLLSSYPLHPPGRPAQMRTAHFPNLRTPCLFVHGTKDPFATTEELKKAVKLIPTKAKVLEISDAGHSLLTKGNRDDLPQAVVNASSSFFAR